MRKAVLDMCADFKRISEYCVFPEITSEESDNCIIIEENKHQCCNPINDEGFAISGITEEGKIKVKTAEWVNEKARAFKK